MLSPDGTNTNWQDQIFRQGTSQNYNLSVSGGSEKTNYYYSAGYNKQVGSIRPNDQTRFSFLTNIDHTVNKYITLGMKLQAARTLNNGLNSGTNALSGNVTSAARLFPNVSVYDANNPTGYNISPDGAVLGNGPNLRGIDNNYTNTRFTIDKNIFRAATNRILSNGTYRLTRSMA